MTGSAGDEIDRIAKRYERRDSVPLGRYSRLNAEVLAASQERQRALVSLLKAHGTSDLADLDIIEIGCGVGANLVELLFLGAAPARLLGNELLAGRIEQARMRLPGSVTLMPGDAAELPLAAASFDIVYQSVVFSSILDDAFQNELAAAMWRWVRPGGGVLWYDFIYDNPSNPDVRGVPLRRVHELFPEGRFRTRRVTLAPPIARRVVRLHRAMYGVCNILPMLRTHVLCLIEKP